MSGGSRWRSRHWQTSEGSGVPKQSEVTQDTHQNYNEQKSWSKEEGNNRNNDGRYNRNDMSVDSYQQHNDNSGRQQSYKSSSMSQSATSSHRGEGIWQRGQSLPSNDIPNNRRTKQQESTSANSNRSNSTGRSNSNTRAATFEAAPTQGAWGTTNKQKVNVSTENRETSSSLVTTEKKGWGKPDNANVVKSAWNQQPKSSLQQAAATTTISSTTNQRNSSNNKANPKSFPTGIMKREDKNSNPWAATNNNKPTTSNDTTKLINTNDELAFPPVSTSGSTNNKQSITKVEEQRKGGSLPSASSWGKSHTPQTSLGLATSKKTQNKQKKKVKAVVDEYPSLSTASKIPQMQHNIVGGQKRPSQSAKADNNTTKGVATAKGKGKKSVPSTNLASFLTKPPQTTGGKSSTKKKTPQTTTSTNTSLKQKATLASFNAINKSNSILGKKRSATTSKGEGNNNTLNFPTRTEIKKGRQHIQPRKKKLTTLKKKVLKERLRLWKEQNGIVDGVSYIDASGVVNSGTTVVAGEEGGVSSVQPVSKRLKTLSSTSNAVEVKTRSTTLLVENYIRNDEDDLTDDDEYDEIISNLISLAGRVGKVVSVFVPRQQPQDNTLETKHVGLAFVRYASSNDVHAANDILNGMIVGGDKIHTAILESIELEQFGSDDNTATPPSAENDKQWHATVLRAVEDRNMSMDVSGTQSTSTSNSQMGESKTVTIVFHKILCDDDYEDDDALQESIEDIKGLAQQYGQVDNVRAATSSDSDKGNVYISYEQSDGAEKALQQLNGIVVGGSKIRVTRDADLSSHQQTVEGQVVLSNVLNDDDYDDEDCLNESLDDIRTLTEQFGIVGSIRAEVTGEQKGLVFVSYPQGHQVAQQAAQKMNGMVIGGLTISASVVASVTADSQVVETKEEAPPPPPMYSGDKIVPDKYAACKRVPKIPNSNPGTPRAYASKIDDETATPLLIEMLGELMRLQERSKDDKNARARRRLVMGLREVARGIRAHKVKMVVMANNLDQYGAIDAKLQEILDLARAEDLPILYELNKRKLGKAIGKSIKVSVIGIQNADGAHDQFKKLKRLLGMY